MTMTENYKILAKFIKDLSSETPNTETYLFVKDNIAKYQLGIDITSKALKNQMVEINTKLKFEDREGNEKKSYFEIIYATIIKVNEKIKLSLSLSAGLLEWKIDGHKLSLTDQSDPALLNNILRTVVPDAKFGFVLFGNHWHFGAAAPNLLQNKITFTTTNNTADNKLEDHYFIHGGYVFNINDDIEIDPYLLLRYVSPAPLQLEFGTKFSWKKMVWTGFTYRSARNIESFGADAASILIGYTHQNNLSFGYAYDFTTSNLGNYSAGSHELLFRILFNRK